MCRSLNIRCRVCANASARMQQAGKLWRSPHSHQTFARAYFPTWTKSGMHAYSAYANDEIQRQPWCRSLRNVNRNTYAVEARLCNVVKGKWANNNAKKFRRHIICMQSRCRVLYAEEAFKASTSYDTQAQTKFITLQRKENKFDQSQIMVNVACHGRVASHRSRRMRS